MKIDLKLKLPAFTKEKRKQDKPAAGSPSAQVIDINLLPIEYRPKPISDWTVIFFVLTMGAAAFLYPLMTWRDAAADQMVRTKAAITANQQSSARVSALQTRIDDLSNTLTQTTKKAAGYKQDFQALSSKVVAWSAVALAVDKQVAAQNVVLQSVTQQSATAISVKGIAPDYEAAVRLSGALLDTKLFSSVYFQQIAQDVPAGKPTATPTPRPGYAFVLMLEVKSGVAR